MTAPSTPPAGPRVLVVSDSADDTEQIARLLRPEFPSVRSSVGTEKAIADFSSFRPEVLVLAFDSLEKAELYYLGLYRTGGTLHPHRSVLLCDKARVDDAFELCKKEYFDDYVLYWPQSHDARRLQMSVLAASRKTGAATPAFANPAGLLAHAKHLADIERIVASSATKTLSARELASSLAPALAGTRQLATAARAVRPLVLIVDDDPFARKLMQQSLDPGRWNAVLATDGPDALAQLRRLRPDVILLDVQMPGMTGIEFATRLKGSEELAGIPVVMITGNARRETLESSIEAGAVSFVVKPMSAAILNAKLDEVVPR